MRPSYSSKLCSSISVNQALLPFEFSLGNGERVELIADTSINHKSRSQSMTVAYYNLRGRMEHTVRYTRRTHRRMHIMKIPLVDKWDSQSHKL